jgi:hypothetical protein
VPVVEQLVPVARLAVVPELHLEPRRRVGVVDAVEALRDDALQVEFADGTEEVDAASVLSLRRGTRR